jgi:hypothetical protein
MDDDDDDDFMDDDVLAQLDALVEKHQQGNQVRSSRY